MKKGFCGFTTLISVVFLSLFLNSCNGIILPPQETKGSISGSVTVDGQTDNKAIFTVYIAGTSYMAYTAANGDFTISDVPAGNNYQLNIQYGTFTCSWKSKVSVSVGKNTDLGKKVFTAEEFDNILANSKGEKGDPGADGVDGVNGVNGANGADGVNGVDGVDGEDGTDGIDGVDGVDGSDLFLETFFIMELQEAGYDTQNAIYFLDGETEIKLGDKIKIEFSAITNRDSDLVFHVSDLNKDWRALSADKHFAPKHGKLFSGVFEEEITRAPSSKDKYACAIKISDKTADESSSIIFTKFDIYLNDVKLDVKINSYYDFFDGRNDRTFVDAVATENGINFSGPLPNYIEAKGCYNVDIRDLENDVSMNRDWFKHGNDWTRWNMTYPLVQAGKTYRFCVTVAWHNDIIYEKLVSIDAIGGLGEFKIENKKDYEITLSEDKVATFSTLPVFTDNPNVNVIKYGVAYDVYKNETPDNFWSGSYEANGVIWDYEDIANIKLDLKTRTNYENLIKDLTGYYCGIRMDTRIKIAGYSDNDTITFTMNDTKFYFHELPGERAKTLVIYTVEYPFMSVFDYKMETIDGEGNNIKIECDNMPGKKMNVVIDGSNYEVYGEIYDTGASIKESVIVPEIITEYTVDGEIKPYNRKYYFTGWNTGFPTEARDNSPFIAEIDGKTYPVKIIGARISEILN